MKKTFFILLLLLCKICSAQQVTTVMFLDIPTVNGEYTTPATRSTVTPTPSKTTNLLISDYSFSWVKDTRIQKGSTTIMEGQINEIGEMTLNFQIDKSVMKLFELLVNNTKTPIMDLFIDKPANNNIPTNQTEIKRIRIEAVTIKELSLTNPLIPQYSLKLKFEKASIIEHEISNIGVVTKGVSYGLNFVTGNTTGIYSF